jgi:two-component system sensor histidine kinase DegS
MTLNFESDVKQRLNGFSRLGTYYILALSGIALFAVIGQVLIQKHLLTQRSDGRIVNLAGTQRYKSQWIVKMSLLLYNDMEHKHFPNKIETLESLMAEWKRGHEGLQHGDEGLQLPGKNSEKILSMFKDLDPYFQNVYKSAAYIIEYKKGRQSDALALQNAIRTLLDNEFIFLKKMDQIVFQYDLEARMKVSTLSKLEYILLAISILVIVLEIVFVFRPTTIQVNRTVNKLISSEKNAQKLTKEIGALYASLESSYEKLSYINQPAENPRLYAKADKGGNIFFLSDLFKDITAIEITSDLRIADLFNKIEDPDDLMDEIIELVSDGETWQGSLRFTDARKMERWTDLIILPVYNEKEEIDELQVFGSDITKQKYAEQNMHIKSRAEIDKKINEQKFRSVLILEGQEEERKRIAMDIHDGIGQQLTSLKFQIESIDLRNDQQTELKINEIKQGIKDVIKEVRRVTFNLKPTVLGDYGMQAALSVFIREIGKLTDIDLTYQTEGEISLRLPQKVENNIFRIVQEAINNSIKYSGATRIEILLQQTETMVMITVKDEGKGFDEKLVESRSVNIESGRGFFNMYERTEYINGHLEIKSVPGQGTTVTLSVPLKSAVTVS